MATARMDLRLDETVKAKAAKASALLGMRSTSEYVASVMNDHATKVIEQHESMTMKDNVFDVFIDACIKVHKPNKALRDAVIFSEDKGIK